MKKLLLALSILLMSVNSHAWTQTPPAPVDSCRIQAPYGFPTTVKPLTPICRHAYLSEYDATAKIPAFVVYTLTAEHALGCVARSNAFAADASIPSSPTPQDYTGTGYDKGHVAPDGDMSFDQQAEYESFLMTNMTPQAPSINRGIWKLLETSVRGWSAESGDSLTIYAGPVYNVAVDKKVGNGVDVPSGYFKIVINDTTGAYAGWQFPNSGNLGNDLKPLRRPVADIEKTVGVKFPLPVSAHELPVGQEWPIDFGRLTKMKKDKCGAKATAD